MSKLYYFAYGSNLHPMRLAERVPSAKLIGAAIHPGHRLTFHKKSTDGSSKCNMFQSQAEADRIHGAIYQINYDHKNELDRYEGNGYMDNEITLHHDGEVYTCFTYLAQQSHIVDDVRPYHWYKKLVVLGARYLEFPSSYISSIEAVESMEDPESGRRRERAKLIEKIISYR